MFISIKVRLSVGSRISLPITIRLTRSPICYRGKDRIEVSVWPDGDGWCASLFIYYSKGPQNILVTFAMHDTFKTYDGAIEAGLAEAQKWIDEGKPAI
jgi:hypothetical protein